MKSKSDKQLLWGQLRKNNNRFTVERNAMLDVMLSMSGHYSVEDFFKAAYKKNAVCAKTTVYRAMPVFVKAGLAKEINQPNGRKRYETVTQSAVK